MKLDHHGSQYSTRYFDDLDNGCAGLKLLRANLAQSSDTELLAKVTYWDAIGDWSFEMFASAEFPLWILDRLVEESKIAVFPPESPRITHLSWGEMEVEGVGIGRDFKLYPGGGRAWDWRENDTHHVPGIQPADAQELIDKGSRIVVLSRGMELALQICPETVRMLEQSGVEYYVNETKEAKEIYNRLVDERKPVGGLFHSTC